MNAVESPVTDDQHASETNNGRSPFSLSASCKINVKCRRKLISRLNGGDERIPLYGLEYVHFAYC